MLMTILSLVLEPNTYSILIKNFDDNAESSTGINVNKQTKILLLGLVPQPWIKTLDHHCVTFSENQMLYSGNPC